MRAVFDDILAKMLAVDEARAAFLGSLSSQLFQMTNIFLNCQGAKPSIIERMFRTRAGNIDEKMSLTSAFIIRYRARSSADKLNNSAT